MKNERLNNTNTLMNIKNQKVILYLTKVVIQLNYSCNNIIPDEKFQRAIVMFTNRNEDFETIKQIIDIMILTLLLQVQCLIMVLLNIILQLAKYIEEYQ